MITITTLHILGNGRSLSLFNRDDWSFDQAEVIGCNFSNPDLNPDYTVIMDAKPMMKLYHGYKLSIPAVISDRCVKYTGEQEGWRKLPKDAITVIDTIKMVHDKGRKYPMNSGHHATLYGIEKHRASVRTVHLWGFDSMWEDDICSYSDEHFRDGMKPRPREPVAREWRLYWDEIFAKYPDIEFVIQKGAVKSEKPS